MNSSRFFLFVLLFIHGLLVNAVNLDIKLLGEKKRVLNAGANFNVMVQVTNSDASDRICRLRIKDKGDGTKLTSACDSLQINPHSSITKLIGFFIPKNHPASNILIELEAIENDGISPFGVINIPVEVLPRYELSISKLKSPSVLFSGDTTTVFFLVRNLSNTKVPVKAQVIDGVTTKDFTYNIPRDSSVVVKYHVTLPKDAEAFSNRSIYFNTSIVDKPESEKTESYRFDVFQIGNIKYDPYNRVPLKITTVGVMANRAGKIQFTGMYDIRANGFIGEPRKRRTFELYLRGPNQSGNPLMGLNNEYYLRYSSLKLEVVAGDYNYGLSELTESSRYGSGIKLKYKFKKFTFGGYYNTPKYFPLIKQVYSTFATYSLNPLNNISLGFLSKIDTSHNTTQLLSLSSLFNPAPWINANLEFATGRNRDKVHNAYKAIVGFRTKFFNSSINYTYADADFPGYIKNSQRIFCNLTLMHKDLSLTGGYNRSSMTQALDTLFSNFPLSESWTLFSAYHISKNHSISLGVMTFGTKDISLNPQFDYKKYNARLNIQSNFKPININLQADLGKMRNFLKESGVELSNFFTGSMNFYSTLSKVFSLNGFANYQYGQKGIVGPSEFYYGTTFSSNFEDKLSISLQYNSNFELKDYTRDRSLFSLDISSNINQFNTISLNANYNLVRNTLDTKEYYVQLRYSHTFNVPVAKRKDVGSLNGRIINHGVESVSRIRLNINGYLAITDKDGFFKFPAIPVGTYTLGIDESSFGLFTVEETPGPYTIVITPGKATYFEFAVTKSARIQGTLVINEDQKASQKGYIPIKEQVDRLIVEASSGSDLFRLLTDKNGNFSFEDLRPGEWNVKVYQNGLPQGYRLVTPQFKVILKAGNEEKLKVLIEKKARQIQFQKK